MGAEQIKAIQTEYKGYRFRSRLEARWAVYFDALGIEWEYEAEGFDLGELGWYLPDFWLPQVGMWAEVKKGPFTDEEFARALSLPDTCVLLDGAPALRPYLTTEEADETYFLDVKIEADYLFEHRFYTCCGCQCAMQRTECYNNCFGEDTKRAVAAARGERFGH